MELTYSREMTICMSHCDARGALGLGNLFSLMLDAATQHAEALGIGSKLLKEKGLFWLTARSSARLLSDAALGQRVTMTTGIAGVHGSHSLRTYCLKRGETIVAQCDTTFVAIDARTHQQLDIAAYCPQLTEGVPGETAAHENIRFDPEKARSLGRYTVRSVDIDLGGHMNNAVYPQVLLGFYSTKELREQPACSLEIAYRRPVLEGEELTGWEAPTKGGRVLALTRAGEVAALARLS